MVSKRERWSVDIPAGLEQWVARRLVSAHQRILNALVLGHILNAVMLFLVFIGDATSAYIPGVTAAIFAACGHRYWLGQRFRKQKATVDPQKMIRALEYNSLFMATVVGITIFLFMPRASAMQEVFLSIVGTTLIAAAGYTMRTLPRAALSYIALISVGMIGGLMMTGRIEAIAACVLLGASALLLARMAITAYKLFVVRILREHEASSSADTVRMLLNDYEDHGSDWLFELDRNSDMVTVSQRFADAVGQKPEELNGRPFRLLFAAGRDRDTLVGHLSARRAFRGLTVQLEGGNAAEPRWWSLSGRPTSGGPSARVLYRGVVSDVSAEKHAEARVRHMAHYDSLTELPNRMMFTQALHRIVADRSAKSRLAVLLIDFDKFKAVNDMYGHPIGDAFLQEAAKRLSSTLMNSNLGGEGRLIARLGGDEFAILMSGEDAIDHCVRLAETLVEAMSVTFDVKGHPVESGISIGIALAPDHADSADILLQNADIALYAAKESGRGRWEMFTPGMDEAIHKRHAIARDLRSAITNGELRLYLQPLVNVESGQKTGFEALVRWEHPERGLVMPNDFIPVAEETGLIVPMGEWVIRTAISQAASWIEPYAISINLSPIQLRSPNLIPVVVRALADTGIDPGRIEFEITESVLMHDCEANIQILNRLHALGLKIALDDFGTGYASLNYLLTFPFDKIKIDRSFITDLETREDCRAIVAAVVGLANRLGMCTLAEGVEQEAQLVKLREQGCEMVQGWLFGKAMPAEHYDLNVPDDVAKAA